MLTSSAAFSQRSPRLRNSDPGKECLTPKKYEENREGNYRCLLCEESATTRSNIF